MEVKNIYFNFILDVLSDLIIIVILRLLLINHSKMTKIQLNVIILQNLNLYSIKRSMGRKLCRGKKS